MKLIDLRKVWIAVVICFSAFLFGAEGEYLAIQGGTIHTVSGDEIPDGIVLIRNGKISAVGRNVSIPPKAEIIDARNLLITPGIIDARSYYGVNPDSDYGKKNLISSTLAVIDWIKLKIHSNWLKGGVTATYISPGTRNLIGGYGAVVKLAGNRKEAVLKEKAGMSISFSEAVFSFPGQNIPTTRQGMVALLRQKFIRAQEYIEQRSCESATDPELDALVPVLMREVPLRAYANSPDDIMTALEIADEFHLDVIIDSGAGAHLVAQDLSKTGVPVVLGPSILGATSEYLSDQYAHSPDNAGKLHASGVKIALSTESFSGRSVLLEGVVAKSHGLPEEAALKAVTLDAAEILGVADRLGSIEAGKDADLVIWEGHPLSTWGESRTVIVDGKIIFERE